MDNKELRKDLIICFRNCASDRKRLRDCVIDIMDAGLTKRDVIAVAEELSYGRFKKEVYLCAVTAIGQAIRYKEKNKEINKSKIKNETKQFFKNKLKNCFKKCSITRIQLRKCVLEALDSGIKKEELLAITDNIVGNFGRNEVSVCAIVAVKEVLMHEEIDRLKNIIKTYAPYMEFSNEKIELKKLND